MTNKKTRRQIEEQKHKLLCGIFPGGCAEKTKDDLARRAWTDTFRIQENFLRPFFAATAPGGSLQRTAVRRFVKNKTAQIAGKMQAGGNNPPGVTRGETSLRGDIAHIGRIGELQNAASAECGYYIKGGKLLFGRAQKMLNMYLKYLWCAGMIDTPPHCPFDDRVIRHGFPKRDDPFWRAHGGVEYLEKRRRHRKIWQWSQSDSVEDYLVWLDAAAVMRERENYDSIAEWELFAHKH